MEKKMIIETERIYMRELNQADFNSLCGILQDDETMYAYEGAFSDREVQEWLDKQIARYQKYKFGLWAVVSKETGQMIGQCGITMQQWKETEVLEIGYLFNKLYWHQGYAAEAAEACRKYAFETLNADEVCSIIRDTNTASQNVALRSGMKRADSFTKNYRGVDMLHYRYIVKNDILRLNEEAADEFWRLRIELFRELGEVCEDDDVSELKSASEQYYLSHINKDLICWGVFREEKLAAIGSLCLFTRIPYKENLSGSEGYILNIYTCPQFRKHGFAKRILDKIVAYSRENNIKRLWLNSSEQGKKLYAECGFTEKGNEMELFL